MLFLQVCFKSNKILFWSQSYNSIKLDTILEGHTKALGNTAGSWDTYTYCKNLHFKLNRCISNANWGTLKWVIGCLFSQKPQNSENFICMQNLKCFPSAVCSWDGMGVHRKDTAILPWKHSGGRTDCPTVVRVEATRKVDLTSSDLLSSCVFDGLRCKMEVCHPFGGCCCCPCTEA